jgi:hypothetical protein
MSKNRKRYVGYSIRFKEKEFPKEVSQVKNVVLIGIWS